MVLRKVLALLALAMIMSGCAGNGAARSMTSARPSVEPSPSASGLSPVLSPSASASSPLPAASASVAAASASCSSQPQAGPLALLGTTSSQTFTAYLESLADPAKPLLVCTITTPSRLINFINPTSLGYLSYSDSNDPTRAMTQITTLNLTTNRSDVVVTVHGDILSMSWSADGSMLAYLLYSYDASGAAYNQLWLKVGVREPTAITPPIPLFGRDGYQTDQLLVRFSPDDKYVLMVDTWVAGGAPPSADQAIIQVRSVPDGKLVWVPPAALGPTLQKGAVFVTMATWSHQSDRVYFQDSSGVHVWSSSGSVSDVAAGLVWYSPSVAPDDSVVAYTVNLPSEPHIELRNLSNTSVNIVPGERGEPYLLTSDLMIETHFGPCSPAGPGCPSSGPEGAPYLLNLATNAETPLTSAASALLDIWPR